MASWSDGREPVTWTETANRFTALASMFGIVGLVVLGCAWVFVVYRVAEWVL